MNELMIFEGQKVEIFKLNGKILFNPYHVGNCLDLAKSSIRNYLAKMNENQAVKVKNSDVRDMDFRKLNNAGEKFLTESGVYKLAFKSHKANAEKFTDWIADEVLPTIRETRSYTYKQQSEKQSQLPQKPEWLVENEETFRYMCNTYGYTRKQLYHLILLEIDKKYDMKEYEVLYKIQVGHVAKYIMEVVAYFENLQEEAERAMAHIVNTRHSEQMFICDLRRKELEAKIAKW